MKKITVGGLSLILLLLILPELPAQMWAVRNITRCYFGDRTDLPAPAAYRRAVQTDIAVFRPATGLWAIRGISRVYFGSDTDTPAPKDYNGDGTADIGIFRPASGLWAIRSVTRCYFGGSGDTVIPEDYNGDGDADLAVFRSASGLWAVRGITRLYFGGNADTAVPADYSGNGSSDIAVFRPSSGLWAIRGITRSYFGGGSDIPVPGDYNKDEKDDIGIFRSGSGLWAIREITRAYFGAVSDRPLPADYNRDGYDDLALLRILTTPIPSPSPSTTPTASPSPSATPTATLTPFGYKTPPPSPTPTATPTPSPSPIGEIYQIQCGGETGETTVNGIVTLVYPDMSFYISENSGPCSGIYIYQSTYGPEIGDSVTVTGEIADYKGKTEIKNLSDFTIHSRNNTPYQSASVSVWDAINNENYEGCLVKISSISVNNQHTGSGKWLVNDGIYQIAVDDELDYNYFPRTGDTFTSIIGIVERNTDLNPDQYLQPRFTADLDASTDIIPHYALKGDLVTMDDSRNVFDNYYIEVKGDLIEEISPDAPDGVTVIDVDGLIFPGLISTHDHLSYGLWDFIPFTIPPYFVGRNAWAASQMYCDFKQNQYNPTRYAYGDRISKLVEVRMASSGGTVTQSQVSTFNRSDDPFAKLGVGIINGERFPGRCKDVVVGTTTSSPDWPSAHQDGVNGKLHRYIIHLAETTDNGGNMMNQWNWWKTHEGFDGRDTIIHGINIPAADYALFNHGTDAFGNPLNTILSWACKSNMLLYDETADIRGALDQGATVCLAPDWTESGMPNMLAELNYCKYISESNGWNIQTRQFIEMVTRNAAAGFSQLDRMGTIEEGKLASFMVIDDGDGNSYDDLLMVAGGGATADYRRGPKDVKLTVVAGRPIYGDSGLLNISNFPFLYSIEDLTICGEPKKLSIARFDNGAYEDVDSDFADFYRELWDAYWAESDYPCDFLPVDPDGTIPWPTPTPI